jgi:hypothetical protein
MPNIDVKVKCKLLVIRQDDVFFAGSENLVKNPDDAQVFTDLESVLDRIRDVVLFAFSPVTQIRIIGID